MKHEVLDLCGLLSGGGRSAGQERWALLGLEALGVLAEAVGLSRVLILAVGNLETAAGSPTMSLTNSCILHHLKHLDMP